MRTLRVLAILTKRQMADDAAYLVPAVVFSLVFVPAVVITVLTNELTAPSSHSVAVFVALPILLCVGSCVLGITQTRADRRSGISELLSTLLAAPALVLGARLTVGVFVILVAMVPLALAGTILWRTMGPPAWLFWGWQLDVFSGMFLAAFASYCLGLAAGMRARTTWRAFRVTSLAILLVLLIVAKGFGWPLVSILLTILVASILWSIRSRLPSWLRVGTAGPLATLFVSTALFWGRFLSDAALGRYRPDRIDIHPSGLLAQEGNASDESRSCDVRVEWLNWAYENRLISNINEGHVILRTLYCSFGGSEDLLQHLGLVEYIQSRRRGSYYVSELGWNLFDFVHLDQVNGQLVCRHNRKRSIFPTLPWDWCLAEERFIGPAGVSGVPTGEIGRFTAPLVGATEFVERPAAWFAAPSGHEISTLALFDTQSRRFFSVDLQARVVSHGPVLQPRSDRFVRVGAPSCRDICRIYVLRPRTAGDPAWNPYVPVICESGRIELLDRDRLEIVGSVGMLPRPRTLFGRGSRRPRDLLASDVVFITTSTSRQSPTADRPGRAEYVGAVAATVSRQGTSMSIAVFDRSGKIVEGHDKEAGMSPKRLIAKYFFECLHPPVLTLVSFLTAYSFEAGATHRALFLMPNSFVAQQRDRETSFVFQFLAALLFLVPALAFSGFLSRQVVCDGAGIGLSRRAKWLWAVGTFAFGLPAYITYRLTRPRVVLTLCTDCGHGRRVDRETCHHCGSGWGGAVLASPAWRVTSP